MGRLLLWVFALLLFAGAVAAILKGLLVIGAVILGLATLVGLYRFRPALFYTVCIVAAVAFMPKKVWPWLAIVAIVWVILEIMNAIFERVRQPKVRQLPPA